MAMGTIMASEVPCARCWVIARMATIKGTMTMPPPTPTSPLIRPPVRPIAMTKGAGGRWAGDADGDDMGLADYREAGNRRRVYSGPADVKPGSAVPSPPQIPNLRLAASLFGQQLDPLR